MQYRGLIAPGCVRLNGRGSEVSCLNHKCLTTRQTQETFHLDFEEVSEEICHTSYCSQGEMDIEDFSVLISGDSESVPVTFTGKSFRMFYPDLGSLVFAVFSSPVLQKS